MPRSVSGQIAMIVVVSVIIVVVVGRVGDMIRHSPLLGLNSFDTFYEQAAAIAPLMRQVAQDRQDDLASAFAGTGLDLRVVDPVEAERLAGTATAPSALRRIINWIFPPDDEPDGSRVFDTREGAMLLIPLNEASTLVAYGPPQPLVSNDVLGPLSYYVLAFATLLILFGLYSRWAFLAPLARISDEVKRSNGTEDERLVSEHGPPEVVALTDALNQMRGRVRDLLETRARMLRGVSHDLRTPLTRLRQRIERLDDEPVQQKMLSDVDQIDRLIEETLDYLRMDATGEELERVDVASLLQTIAADFADLGSAIRYEGPDHLAAMLKPNSMLRAVTNLCGNGLKFGTEVSIILSRNESSVRIDVVDDGPGIPANLRDRVLEPFFKADLSRSDGDRNQGFGLGLSIVAEIVAAHRGRLTLLDNEPSGLVARVEFPR
ncbi:sensor histidine kinase [Mangrovicella endophytica]|uniref:sensor histidine kinase n=1 Tax=Mangrovicella endophytica TaxID=2066697 RepID=UPI000C9E30DC|nr:ATP-binding protein [Mangrovicella endophytica]